MKLTKCLGLMVMLWAVGCGSDPGGSVGASCESIGESSECAEDEVCDSVSGFASEAYCLRVCEQQSDCESGENCNGISGGSGKACQPKADDETSDVEDAQDDQTPKNG